MLIPAILRTEQLVLEFNSRRYTDEMFYFSGASCDNSEWEPATDPYIYQYAIVSGEILLGYFDYVENPATDTIHNIGLISFYRCNPILGKDIYVKMRELIKAHRRVEWKMIGGNEAEGTYDRLCLRYGGNKVVLHDVLKDRYGNYHDDIIYEIARRKKK